MFFNFFTLLLRPNHSQPLPIRSTSKVMLGRGRALFSNVVTQFSVFLLQNNRQEVKLLLNKHNLPSFQVSEHEIRNWRKNKPLHHELHHWKKNTKSFLDYAQRVNKLPFCALCVAWILKSGRLSPPQDGTHACFLKRDILVCFTYCQRVCEEKLKYSKKYHQGVTILEESTATCHIIRKCNHNAGHLIETIPFKKRNSNLQLITTRCD